MLAQPNAIGVISTPVRPILMVFMPTPVLPGRALTRHDRLHTVYYD